MWLPSFFSDGLGSGCLVRQVFLYWLGQDMNRKDESYFMGLRINYIKNLTHFKMGEPLL